MIMTKTGGTCAVHHCIGREVRASSHERSFLTATADPFRNSFHLGAIAKLEGLGSLTF